VLLDELRKIGCALIVFASAAMMLTAAGGRHVIGRIPIPGDTGWDYLMADSQGRRLYVSHDTEVVVIDLDTRKIVGKVPGSKVHGVAVVPEVGRGFVSCSDPGSVVIFDLKTFAVTGKVRVGDDPNAIFYDPSTKRVYTIDRGSKRVSAIDPKTGQVTGSVEGLGGRTEHAVADETGQIYLNMQSLGTMLRIDARALKVTATWNLAPCEQPSSMEMDRKLRRIFVGCRNGLMAVVDADNGRVVTTQPIGKGVDASEFDLARGIVYFSTGADGALWVFRQDSPEKYTLVETVKTAAGSRTMAVDQKTGKAYLSAAEFGPRPETAPGAPPRRAPMIPGSFSVLIVGE
jgi:YVTN family beta-propeller protein